MMKDTSPKDMGIFTGWIVGLLAIGGLLWFFTQPIRIMLLQKNVNTLLANMGHFQYLEAAVPQSELPKRRMPLGTWYTLRGSNNRALVFSMIADGIRSPYVAIVSDAGKVDEIIPLNTHAEHTLKQLPQGIKSAYIQRIEKDLRQNREEGL